MRVHFTERGWEDYRHWAEEDAALIGVYRIEGKAGTDRRIEIAACRYHY